MSFEKSWHKSYAPGVPREMDFERITLPEILTRTADRFPDVTALIFLGKKVTYRGLEAQVNRFAKALTEIGVKAGDRVAMLLPNMPQLVIANYAALRIGAVPVPNNPLCTEEELAHQLNDSGAKVMVALDLLFPRAHALMEKTGIRSIIACHISDYLPFPSNKILSWVRGQLYYRIPRNPGIHEFLPLLQSHPATPVENAAQWEEVGALLYTAGTTGESKGVMVTHGNLSCNVQQLRAWFPEAKDGLEGILAVLPFFHPAGWTGIQNLSILAGWTDILVPRPDSQTAIDIMKKIKPTLLPGTPAIFTDLLESETFRKMDLSPVKAFLAGGAPLPARLSRRLKGLREVPVINLYGLTELSPMATATPWGGEERPGTAGTPLPGTDLMIVNPETGTGELPAGEAGEICLRGPQVMKGYHGKPKETDQVLKDGWLHTGDIGFLDTDGHLTILGRKKDMIAIDGCNVYPGEVDDVLLDHPKVLEACTVGSPGGTAKSFVVLRPSEEAGTGEIFAFCREKLAPCKVPSTIEFIKELPKNAMGEVLRRVLKEHKEGKQEGK